MVAVAVEAEVEMHFLLVTSWEAWVAVEVASVAEAPLAEVVVSVALEEAALAEAVLLEGGNLQRQQKLHCIYTISVII